VFIKSFLGTLKTELSTNRFGRRFLIRKNTWRTFPYRWTSNPVPNNFGKLISSAIFMSQPAKNDLATSILFVCTQTELHGYLLK